MMVVLAAPEKWPSLKYGFLALEDSKTPRKINKLEGIVAKLQRVDVLIAFMNQLNALSNGVGYYGHRLVYKRK
jgi:hypothetical protein